MRGSFYNRAGIHAKQTAHDLSPKAHTVGSVALRQVVSSRPVLISLQLYGLDWSKTLTKWISKIYSTHRLNNAKKVYGSTTV